MTEGISLFLSRDIPSVYIKKEDGHIFASVIPLKHLI